MEKGIFNEETLRPFHQEQIVSMKIPSWMYSFSCSECKKPFSPDSIRGISLCLNAKDLGNFSISVHCRECNAGYDLIIPEACKSIEDFVGIIKSWDSPYPAKEFLPEHKQKTRRNNLVEKYLKILPKASSEGP